MGQFGSSRSETFWGKARGTRLQLLLVLGFGVSSMSVVAAVAALRHGFAPATSLAMRTALVIVVMSIAVFGLVHALAPSRLRPPMLRRQTAYAARAVFGDKIGAFWWGLDAGLMVTTYRVGWGTWTLLALIGFGFTPWWVGAFYTAGFGVPLLLVTAMLAAYPNGTRSVAMHFANPRAVRLASATVQAAAVGAIAIAVI
jgi:hypothetical protein